MVDIEKMNGKYRHTSPVVDLKSTAGAFACDILELAELQGKLFHSDAKSAMRKSLGALAAIIVSCSCLLGCIPVVIFGLASAVAFYFNMEIWVAQLIVGGSFSIAAAIIAAIAFKNLSTLSHQFTRSTDEFSKNIEWTKNVFRGVSSQ